MNQQPVFLMATSPRTGSTWLQRVLTAHGIMIWGEFSILTCAWLYKHLKFPSVSDVGNNWDIHSFRKTGPNMWMAVLGPEEKDVLAGLRAYAETAFGPPALALGYDRWGAKETMWDVPDMQVLRLLYPEAPVIYLGRNFLDSYHSRHGQAFRIEDSDPVTRTMNERANKMDFCRRWVANTRYVINDTHKNSLFLRYEDLLKDYGEIRRMFAWLGMKACSQEDTVKRVGGVIGSTAAERVPLSNEDKFCIERYSAEIGEVSTRYESWQPQH